MINRGRQIVDSRCHELRKIQIETLAVDAYRDVHSVSRVDACVT